LYRFWPGPQPEGWEMGYCPSEIFKNMFSRYVQQQVTLISPPPKHKLFSDLLLTTKHQPEKQERAEWKIEPKQASQDEFHTADDCNAQCSNGERLCLSPAPVSCTKALIPSISFLADLKAQDLSTLLSINSSDNELFLIFFDYCNHDECKFWCEANWCLSRKPSLSV